MQNKIATFFSISLVLVLCFNISVNAQVNGNGEIESRSFELNDFDKIELNIPVELDLEVGSDQSVEITTDSNIFESMTIESKKSKFYVDQNVWIRPTQTVKIKITVPSLSYIGTSGYGDYFIKIPNGESLIIRNEVGSMTIVGFANQLTYLSNTGKLNAEAFEVNDAEVTITSFGRARVNPNNSLIAKIDGNGRIVYVNQPNSIEEIINKNGHVLSRVEEIALNEVEKTVQYVNIELKNNKMKRIHTRIEGPFESPFGYGAPFNPLQKKKERWPVGTKVYQKGKFGSETLLYEVKAEDDGKTIKLFKEA